MATPSALHLAVSSPGDIFVGSERLSVEKLRSAPAHRRHLALLVAGELDALRKSSEAGEIKLSAATTLPMMAALVPYRS